MRPDRESDLGNRPLRRDPIRPSPFSVTQRYYFIASNRNVGITDIMLSLRSPAELAAALAARIRTRRLQRGWTQAELAARACLKQPTYVLFERTGQISLLRLLKVLEILDLSEEFDRIARQEDLTGLKLDDIIKKPRQRGRRNRL